MDANIWHFHDPVWQRESSEKQQDSHELCCVMKMLDTGYFMFLPVWMLMFSPQVKQYIYISCPYLVPFFVHLPRRLDPELQLGSFLSFLRRS